MVNLDINVIIELYWSPDLYRLMPTDEQDRLIENLVNSLKTVPEFIQERMVKHFSKADSTWGERVAKGLRKN